MKALVLSFAGMFLFGAGILVGVFVAGMSQSTRVHIFVDRTPAPQELEIRQAAQALLDAYDAYNERRFRDAYEAFASFCRPSSAEAIEEGWADAGDFRFELRRFRVTEIHGDTALVESDVYFMDEFGSGPYGPNHGEEPWLNSFTFEDGQWRACQ